MAFTFNNDTLRPALEDFDRRAQRGIELGFSWGEDRAEEYARVNASWRDQTGNARSGLTARYVRKGKEHRLILFHRMSYGIWLETRFSGRYAIIMPTLQAIQEELLSVISESISRAVGGR